MEKFIFLKRSAVLDTALFDPHHANSVEVKHFVNDKIISTYKDIRLLIDGSSEDAEKAFHSYISEFTEDERESLRCCTFTILPAHWKKYLSVSADVNDVMMSYLELKSVNGMFVIEYTKRGVPHIHGISPNVHERCNRFWGASCRIKKINEKGIDGWITYCCKDKISDAMNKRFMPSDRTPKLCIYTLKDFYDKS